MLVAIKGERESNRRKGSRGNEIWEQGEEHIGESNKDGGNKETTIERRWRKKEWRRDEIQDGKEV